MDIKNKLLEYEQKLINAKKHTFFSNDWKQIFPNHSGVYVVWENEQPIYVGETSGLKSRMSDIMRPINHAFTKKISNKFNLSDLNKLRKFMTEKYKLSFIQIKLGRSEIEEYLILRWRETLINKPTTRLLKGEQYSWVKAV
jgi:hypothetical protein